MEARSLSPYSPSVIISTPLSRRLQKDRRYARLFHVSFFICSNGWWKFLQQGWCTHLAIEKQLWLHFPAGTRNDKPSSPGVKSRWLTCIQCCFATQNVDTCSLNHPLLSKHSGCSSHLLSWLFQTVTYNGIWAWDHFNRTTCFCQFAMFVQNVSPSLLCYGFHKLWTAILKKRHFSNWWFPWQFGFHMTNLTHDMAVSIWMMQSQCHQVISTTNMGLGNNISSDIAVSHTHTGSSVWEFPPQAPLNPNWNDPGGWPTHSWLSLIILLATYLIWDMSKQKMITYVSSCYEGYMSYMVRQLEKFCAPIQRESMEYIIIPSPSNTAYQYCTIFWARHSTWATTFKHRVWSPFQCMGSSITALQNHDFCGNGIDIGQWQWCNEAAWLEVRPCQPCPAPWVVRCSGSLGIASARACADMNSMLYVSVIYIIKYKIKCTNTVLIRTCFEQMSVVCSLLPCNRCRLFWGHVFFSHNSRKNMKSSQMLFHVFSHSTIKSKFVSY